MLRSLLEEAAAVEPSKSWPTFDGKELDRSDFLNASEIGQCLRQTFFNKQFPGSGYQTNGYAERGHAIEEYIAGKLALLRGKHEIHYMGTEQRSFYDADRGMSATPDGIIKVKNDWNLIDFKSLDPRTDKNKLPKRGHVLQVTAGMFLVNSCRPEYNVKLARIWYIDASDIHDIIECQVPYDGELAKAVIARAELLWKAKKATELAAEGIETDGCTYCAHHDRCSDYLNTFRSLGVADQRAVGFSLENLGNALTPMEYDLLGSYIGTYTVSKRAEKDLKEAREPVVEVVKRLGGEVVTEVGKFNYNEQAGRSTIDADALRADGIDPEKYTKRGAPFGVLRITPYS